MLEKIQRRATKIPNKLRHLAYEDRLRAIGLPKLENRRMRGDLIQFFKIFKGFEEVNLHVPLTSLIQKKEAGSAVATRGNSLRVNLERLKGTGRYSNVRSNFVTNRAGKNWNKLPEEVVAATGVNQFKERFDRIGLKILFKCK